MAGGHTWNPKGSLNPAFKGGKITDIELVRRLYETDKKSIRQVASHCGCSLRTAVRWLHIHNISIRDNITGIRLRYSLGGRSSNWKGGPKPCPQCGGKKGRSSNICIKCFTRPTGSRNPNWRGRADVAVGVRQWVKQHWRIKVFERDKFTCQKCGDSRGKNLQAHHKTRLSVLIKSVLKDLNIIEVPENAEARHHLILVITKDPKISNIENGITVCKQCHTIYTKVKEKNTIHYNIK